MKKNLTLKKDQINAIKFFIRKQQENHKYGEWDKFIVTSLKVHTDGYYSFKVHWMSIVDGVNEDYWIEGNLFEEFPVRAVLDGLDAVDLMFYDIHLKAYERAKRYSDKQIDIYKNANKYLKELYKIETNGYQEQ